MEGVEIKGGIGTGFRTLCEIGFEKGLSIVVQEST